MKTLKTYLFFTTLFVAFQSFSQSNVFLDRAFWDTKPTVEVIKEKIEKGHDPSEANSNNFDGVVYAILQKAPFKSITYLMSQKGNDVNKLTHDGRTYIFWAAYKGNVQLMKYLLDHGAKTNIVDDHGATILNFAAGTGQKNKAVYELCLANGADLQKDLNPNGANALLLIAPSDPDLELVKYFESKDLSIKSKDANGNGIFNYVARTGNISLMNKLIEMDLKGTDQAYIFTAYGTRGKTNTLETYEYLESVGLNPKISNNKGMTPLHIVAARSKDKDIVTFFLKKGLDVNAMDDEGNTPFLNAVSRNDLSIIKLLFPEVKDVDQSNHKRETALALAVKNNSLEVVDFLLDKKADIKFEDKNGNNIVYYLVEGYSSRNEDLFFEKLKLLQDNGVDLTATQGNGNTLFHLAAEKQNLKMLELAANQKIDLNAKNNDGNTALHIAAMKAKDDKMLKFLLSHGADKKRLTEFGESAYDLAKENELLKMNGISVEFLK